MGEVDVEDAVVVHDVGGLRPRRLGHDAFLGRLLADGNGGAAIRPESKQHTIVKIRDARFGPAGAESFESLNHQNLGKILAEFRKFC